MQSELIAGWLLPGRHRQIRGRSTGCPLSSKLVAGGLISGAADTDSSLAGETINRRQALRGSDQARSSLAHPLRRRIIIARSRPSSPLESKASLAPTSLLDLVCLFFPPLVRSLACLSLAPRLLFSLGRRVRCGHVRPVRKEVTLDIIKPHRCWPYPTSRRRRRRRRRAGRELVASSSPLLQPLAEPATSADREAEGC